MQKLYHQKAPTIFFWSIFRRIYRQNARLIMTSNAIFILGLKTFQIVLVLGYYKHDIKNSCWIRYCQIMGLV